jgi:hypothetical protein
VTAVSQDTIEVVQLEELEPEVLHETPPANPQLTPLVKMLQQNAATSSTQQKVTLQPNSVPKTSQQKTKTIDPLPDTPPTQRSKTLSPQSNPASAPTLQTLGTDSAKRNKIVN